MSSYNKVIMVGRLTKDPEVKQTPAGKTVAKFSLAVDRRGSGDRRIHPRIESPLLIPFLI
jgi:single-strand DNA-binding protein